MSGTNGDERTPSGTAGLVEHELLTIAEAADVLRLAPWTLRHWVSDGKIQFVKLGRMVRIRRRDLDRMITQNLCGVQKQKRGNNGSQGLL